MKKGTHGIEEKSFEELSYASQARSINAQISVLKKALKVHNKRAQFENKNINEMKSKYRIQINKIITELN